MKKLFNKYINNYLYLLLVITSSIFFFIYIENKILLSYEFYKIFFYVSSSSILISIIINSVNIKYKKYLICLYLSIFYFTSVLLLNNSFLQLNLLFKFFIFVLILLVSYGLYELLIKQGILLKFLLLISLITPVILSSTVASNSSRKEILITNDWKIYYSVNNKKKKIKFDLNFDKNSKTWKSKISLPKGLNQLRLDPTPQQYMSIKKINIYEDNKISNKQITFNKDVESKDNIYKISGGNDPIFYIKKHDDETFDSKVTLEIIFDEHNLENKKNYKFSSSPNIYVLYPDSLYPSSLTKKYLDFDIYSYLPSLNKFLFLKNSYSDGFPTWNSLNTTLASSTKIYDSLGGAVYPEFELQIFNKEQGISSVKTSDQLRIFRGQTPSIFYDIVHSNGYKVITGASHDHLGVNKGQYIDKFHLNQSSICKTLPKEQKFIFAGYCYFNSLFYAKNNPLKDYLKRFFDSIKNEDKLFSFITIYSPGHASAKYYNHDMESKRTEFIGFFKNRLKETDSLLDYYLKEIEKKETKNNQGYVVLIFGDHAPWLSANQSTKNENFFVHGRFSVMGSCYSNKSFCENIIKKNNELGFITPSIALKELFNSLAKREIFDDKFLIDDHYIGQYFDEKRNYKDFNYE